MKTLDSLDEEGLYLSIAHKERFPLEVVQEFLRTEGLHVHICKAGLGYNVLATTTSTVESILQRLVNFLVLKQAAANLVLAHPGAFPRALYQMLAEAQGLSIRYEYRRQISDPEHKVLSSLLERPNYMSTSAAAKTAHQKVSQSIGSRWLRVASKLAFVRQDVLAMLVRGASRKRSKGSRVVQQVED